ncbi:MAG TPA: ABC transporter permease [Stellaceae bacterium]
MAMITDIDDIGEVEAHDEPEPPAPSADAVRERLLRTAKSWAIRTLAVAAGLVLWYIAARARFDFYIRFDNIPSPLKVAAVFWQHLHELKFYIHIGVSLERILSAYVLASVVGIFLGLLMGRSRLARDLLIPYIELLRPIPAVAWIPLAILMWPTEESSIIYITFLGALFPIVLNTVHGVEQTPELLVRAAQSLGARRIEIFWHVVIPAALPSIAAGLSISMGVAWFAILAGEIISGQYGIGYFTWNAYSLINYPDIIVGMLMIGVLGTLSAYAVRLLTYPLLAWQRRTR